MSCKLRVTLDGIGNHISVWESNSAAWASLVVAARRRGFRITLGNSEIRNMAGQVVGNWSID